MKDAEGKCYDREAQGLWEPRAGAQPGVAVREGSLEEDSISELLQECVRRKDEAKESC